MKGYLAVVALILAAALGVGAASSGVLEFVSAMGHEIPVADVAADYVIGLTWAILVGLSIRFWPLPAQDRRLLRWGWVARSVVTLGFMLFYENYYSVDAYWYFDFPRWRQDWPETFMFGNGLETVYFLSWLHHQVLPDSYHMMKVSFSMVGLVAVYIFYRAATKFLRRDDPRIFYALALFPSVLFWSSILGKDPIVLLGIAIYAYGVVGWGRTHRLRFLWLIGLGILETMFVRVWLGTILMIPLAVFVVQRMRAVLTKMVFVTLIALAAASAMQQFKEQFRIENRQDFIATTQSLSNSFAFGGSGNVQEREFTSVGEIVKFLPIGVFSALFRPLPGEVKNPFGFMAGLENLLLLFILFKALYRTRLAELKDPIVLWALALVLTWSSAYGLVSYQNLGAAVRFRLQILPILLGLLLYLNRKRAGGPAGAPAPEDVGRVAVCAE